MSNVYLSIVIPVFKSDKSLEIIVERIKYLKNKVLFKKKIEIIFVNDSPFHLPTALTLKTIQSTNNFIKVIELTKNYGQHAATLAGLKHTQGEFIVTMDDDLQHDPSFISRLLEKNKHDIVIANFNNKKHSILKKITSVLKQYFDRIILEMPKNIRLSSFRLFRRDTLNHVLKLNTSYPFLPALFFQVTADVVNINIDHNKRIGNESEFTFSKRLTLFKNLIFNNSYILLKILSFVGFFSLILSLLFSLLIVYDKIVQNTSMSGWSSIVVLILFFGGMTMISLGIFGEYLVRIIHTSENRPHYFIKAITQSKK
jgi:glycosyltransferase involved in cell wall biosynthesis